MVALMSKPSRRDLDRQRRRTELENDPAISNAGPNNANDLVTPTGADAAGEGVAGQSHGLPSPAQPAVEGESGAGDVRHRGAGVSKILNNLGDGLAGQLRRAEEQRDELQSALDEANRVNEEIRMRMEAQALGEEDVPRLDPSLIRPTRFDNRDDKSFTDDDPEFRALKADIAEKGGNVMEALVRPLDPPEGKYLYEVVYGHRRLAAVQQLGLQLKTLIKSVPDEEAMLLQHVENAFRKKLSTMETGRKIRSFLEYRRTGTGRAVDGSLNLLVGTLKMEKTHIAKLSLIGSIPDEIIQVIPDIRQIPYRPALQLAKLCRDSLDDVVVRLPEVDEQWSSKKVVNHLIGGAGSRAKAPVAGNYKLVMPDDEETRRSLRAEFKALEEKYGIRLNLTPEPGGGLQS